MKSTFEPKVTLVGAGPGASDLITIRGLRALKDADVVLYDALIDEELLQFVGEKSKVIYVGKRCGTHSRSQEQINELIVKMALEFGHVVRLKGGDPFVFGRACEEIEYVESFGIPVTVVPGVSSAIAVPSSQGIPMTSRGLSSSFWVMTATKRDGNFSEDLQHAARSTATLVILMGIRKAAEIMLEVSRYRDSSTPAAIIQNGTNSNEQCFLGTLSSFSTKLPAIDCERPGIIVIGDVVAKHPLYFNEEVQRILFSAF
ncbi:uroporphyrinogen-III C-methyltransferase [Cytophaga sp. FL35]|uniref:uroporphyrinogen-III C-methyltransferase n=1 Tax=Cytophaga sp. FL35 TaxID=1904456 RepID=UPI001653E0FF|nr:uroporphyrinogen-III C-methyltransferase [Cytophaga sp. FL35]MBC6996952.1 uroporphyrinogen-III C-methyltransferase [Cytophaga sp. FL35]